MEYVYIVIDEYGDLYGVYSEFQLALAELFKEDYAKNITHSRVDEEAGYAEVEYRAFTNVFVEKVKLNEAVR